MRLAVTKESRPHLTINYRYILDKGFANESIVLLTKCLNHFCEVEDIETHERWETMTNRLSELETPPTHVVEQIERLVNI